jgi:hypothetical protein
MSGDVTIKARPCVSRDTRCVYKKCWCCLMLLPNVCVTNEFAMIPKLKLQYLPMQGRAEGIRMYMKHCGLEFEDEVLEFDAFARVKESHQLPFDQVCTSGLCTEHVSASKEHAAHKAKCGRKFISSVACGDLSAAIHAWKHACLPSTTTQVPVLLVGDRPIAQTGSILRYIYQIAGRPEKDPVLLAQADSAFEAAQEMPMSQIYVAVNLMEEAEAKDVARSFKAALTQYLRNWTKLLGQNSFFHGGQHALTHFLVLPLVTHCSKLLMNCAATEPFSLGACRTLYERHINFSCLPQGVYQDTQTSIFGHYWTPESVLFQTF